MNNDNNHEELVDKYSKSHEKPDKLYSMLPTVLSLCVGAEHIVDVGCGDGFFTEKLAEIAQSVTGIDICEEQLKRANGKTIDRAEFLKEDMKTFDYAGADLVHAPYVVNYFPEASEVQAFFSRICQGLKSGGKLVAIVDMPNSIIHDMQKFGSIKCLNSLHDGEKLTIHLFHGNEELITLSGFFYTKETLGKLLYSAGFKQVTWHTPVVSEEGMKLFGYEFWKEYLERCDVAYFTAVK